jgi:hypothetical protein
VVSEYIGVNERGVVKVWAGSQWPQIGAVGGKLPQEEMVKSIVDSLQPCEDSQPQISIPSFLYRNSGQLSFDHAMY